MEQNMDLKQPVRQYRTLPKLMEKQLKVMKNRGPFPVISILAVLSQFNYAREEKASWEKTLATFIIVAPLLLTGCASNQLAVTYNSDPPGATLVQANGQNFGRTPVTLKYQISEADRSRGNKTLMGISAQWPSGARASSSSITANLKNGTSQSFTFSRPQNAPELAIDMQYALELEKLAEMQRQSAAQENAAYEARRAASAAEEATKAAKQRASLPPPGITCVDLGVRSTSITCF